jgi:hypothetical protein
MIKKLFTLFLIVLIGDFAHSQSIWDSNYCSGENLTSNDVIDQMQGGTTRLNYFGYFTLYQRQRECNPFTGCTVWTEINTDIGYPTERFNFNYVDAEVIDLKGTVDLSFVRDFPSTCHVLLTSAGKSNLGCAIQQIVGYSEPLGNTAFSVLHKECFQTVETKKIPIQGSNTGKYYELQSALIGSLGPNAQLPVNPELFGSTTKLDMSCNTSNGTGIESFSLTLIDSSHISITRIGSSDGWTGYSLRHLGNLAPNGKSKFRQGSTHSAHLSFNGRAVNVKFNFQSEAFPQNYADCYGSAYFFNK